MGLYLSVNSLITVANLLRNQGYAPILKGTYKVIKVGYLILVKLYPDIGKYITY